MATEAKGDFAAGRNVDGLERAFSVAAGAALVLFGIRRFSFGRLSLAALGANLIKRGVTGHCALYQKLGIGTTDHRDGIRGNLGTRVERAVVVYAPPDRIYRFWRTFSNLPRFMDSLESVEMKDANRSHWVARGPGGVRVEWDAEIINEVPDELIAWCSRGGVVEHAGSVHFEPGPGGRGTVVRVALQYDPPGGSAGHAVASWFGGDAGSRLEHDLQAFKRVIESGEAVA